MNESMKLRNERNIAMRKNYDARAKYFGKELKKNIQNFNNCCQQVKSNSKRRKARDLLRQGLAEASAPQSATAPAYVPSDKPWILPTIEDNMTYHTSWAKKDISGDVAAIGTVMSNARLTCEISQVNQGAMITQYLLKPTGSTRFSHILKLQQEFMGAFNSNSVRLYQNGAYIVIEVPGASNSVRVADILRCDAFRDSRRMTVAIGMGIDGSSVLADIEKMPHLLIAGTTGSGKSVFMQGLIVSLLLKHSPSDMELYMVDPKMVEFSYYERLCMCHVVTEVKDAVALLEELCKDMDNRYRELAANGVRDINEYNSKMSVPMKRKVVFVDELADLIMTSKKSVENCIVRLAQKARACGIHLVLATQRPTVNVVTGLIKSNIPTKVCFAVPSYHDSMVMLDKAGAENLLGKGDMLYRTGTGVDAIRLQGGFINSTEINNIVFELLKNQR